MTNALTITKRYLKKKSLFKILLNVYTGNNVMTLNLENFYMLLCVCVCVCDIYSLNSFCLMIF